MCVSLLFQYNADPNIFDKDNCTPLMVACQNGHDVCVLLLLQNKGDPNMVLGKQNVTSLYLACQNGHDKSLLLQYNVDPNTSSKDKCTPLHMDC